MRRNDQLPRFCPWVFHGPPRWCAYQRVGSKCSLSGSTSLSLLCAPFSCPHNFRLHVSGEHHIQSHVSIPRLLSNLRKSTRCASTITSPFKLHSSPQFYTSGRTGSVVVAMRTTGTSPPPSDLELLARRFHLPRRPLNVDGTELPSYTPPHFQLVVSPTSSLRPLLVGHLIGIKAGLLVASRWPEIPGFELRYVPRLSRHTALVSFSHGRHSSSTLAAHVV